MNLITILAVSLFLTSGTGFSQSRGNISRNTYTRPQIKTLNSVKTLSSRKQWRKLDKLLKTEREELFKQKSLFELYPEYYLIIFETQFTFPNQSRNEVAKQYHSFLKTYGSKLGKHFKASKLRMINLVRRRAMKILEYQEIWKESKIPVSQNDERELVRLSDDVMRAEDIRSLRGALKPFFQKLKLIGRDQTVSAWERMIVELRSHLLKFGAIDELIELRRAQIPIAPDQHLPSLYGDLLVYHRIKGQLKESSAYASCGLKNLKENAKKLKDYPLHVTRCLKFSMDTLGLNLATNEIRKNLAWFAAARKLIFLDTSSRVNYENGKGMAWLFLGDFAKAERSLKEIQRLRSRSNTKVDHYDLVLQGMLHSHFKKDFKKLNTSARSFLPLGESFAGLKEFFLAVFHFRHNNLTGAENHFKKGKALIDKNKPDLGFYKSRIFIFEVLLNLRKGKISQAKAALSAYKVYLENTTFGPEFKKMNELLEASVKSRDSSLLELRKNKAALLDIGLWLENSGGN